MLVEKFFGVLKGVVALLLASGFHAVDADGGGRVGQGRVGVLVCFVEGVARVGGVELDVGDLGKCACVVRALVN